MVNVFPFNALQVSGTSALDATSERYREFAALDHSRMHSECKSRCEMTLVQVIIMESLHIHSMYPSKGIRTP